MENPNFMHPDFDKFSEEWQNKTVTISRIEFGNLIANEIKDASDAMAIIDKDLANYIEELLVNFSASIAAQMFSGDFGVDDEDEEEDV